MRAAVKVTRDEMTARDLCTAAGRVKDGKVARRMLAIALVLEGTCRKAAAESCGMDRQTLRDWVHRYNAASVLMVKAFEVSIVCFQKAASLRGLPTFSSRQ